MKNRTRLPDVYLAAILIVMFMPIIIVIIYSFNESRISSVWGGFSLRWYADLFRDRSIFTALRNSLILAAVSSVAAAVIGTLGAVGMHKSDYKASKAIEYISTLPIMIPEIILGIVFLLFFALLSFRFGMLTLVVAHTAFCIPYIFILVKSRLVGLDKSIEEAAKDLGAGNARVFFDITLPLIMPSILSGVVLSFAMSFDDVVISTFVTGVNTNTLPLKIYTQLKTGVTPKINALCSLIFAVTVLLCIVSMYLQKRKD